MKIDTIQSVRSLTSQSQGISIDFAAPTMLRVRPIYGSQYDKRGVAHVASCTLVEYGGVTVLVNAGWDDSMTKGEFPDLPAHQALLLTDSTLGAMGGLPLYHRQCPSSDLYATFPTVKMGQMTLYDYHASLSLDGGTPPYTLGQIDAACDALHTIKYSQHIVVRHPDTQQPALSITAQRAGHVVGGAFFIIQRLQDETSVVVTSTYNIGKELHLDSATLVKYGATPDVLVTRPGGPAMPFLSNLYGGMKSRLPTPVVSQAERALVETVLAVLRREGNVLLPVDASGRVLEVLLLLSQQWDKQRLAGAYNLCWAGPMTQNTMDFARSQLEWMAAPLGSQFDSQRGHPFQMNNVSVCSSMSELEAVLDNGNPSCVIASGASLDHGFARDLLLKFADNPDNAIVFTDSSRCVARGTIPERFNETINPLSTSEEEGEESFMIGSAIPPDQLVSVYSTAAQLILHWGQAKLEGREMEDVVEVDVMLPHRSPLAGIELKSFLAQEEASRQAQKADEERRAMLREVEIAKGQLRLGEDDTAGSDAIAANVAPRRTQTTRLMSSRPTKKSRFDSSLFLKFSKPLHPTFEVREEAVGIGQPDSVAKFGVGESVGRTGEIVEDDYGIAVLPERFVDIVTGVDPSKFSGGSGRIGEEVRRRGLGFGADGHPVLSSKSGDRTAADGQHGKNDSTTRQDGAQMDEQALESEDLSEGTGIIRGRNGRPPVKVSTIPRRLEVLAEIAYVPLEGRVHSGVARQTTRALQPRQIVVVGGRSSDEDDALVDEVSLLADAAQSVINEERLVFSPADGETAELHVGHAAYSVRLIDTPYMTAEEIAHQETNKDPQAPPKQFETQLGECVVSLFDGVATGRRVALDGSLVLAPHQAMCRSRLHMPIYISNGDVLLTDLRSELVAQGMKADYRTRIGYAQLVVNGKVIIKKEQESGRFAVEGPLCEDFFIVQAAVRSQYATF